MNQCVYQTLQSLTVDEKVVEVGATLDRGVQESCDVRAVFCEVLHFSLVLQTQLWKHHVPVLSVPHKQWNSPALPPHTVIERERDVCVCVCV